MTRCALVFLLVLAGCSDNAGNGGDTGDTGASDVRVSDDARGGDTGTDAADSDAGRGDDGAGDDASDASPDDTTEETTPGDADPDAADGGDGGDPDAGPDADSDAGDAPGADTDAFDGDESLDADPDADPDAGLDADASDPDAAGGDATVDPDAPCVDACEAGSLSCDGDRVVRCVDADRDGCVEPVFAARCLEDEVCVAGVCGLPRAPVIISEIWYDTPSGDAQSFIELYGPPGTRLGGFSLVGINGANGDAYVTIDLTGTIPDDGLYVVARTRASGDVRAAANQLDDLVDMQNGPDSVELRSGDELIDAVGYGRFTAAELRYFRGEGSSAPAPTDSQSLARDRFYTDTNNNAVDFRAGTPTPGAPNVPANRAPTARISGPTTAVPGETVSLDGAASSDPDGDGLVHAWTLTRPDGSAAGLSSTDSESTRFVADVSGTYRVELTVADPTGLSASTTVTIVVAVAPNRPPVAVAGADLSMPPDDIVVIDGSGSFDPDGTIVAFAWALVSSPADAVYEIVDADTAELWFTALTEGTYTLRLTVTDDDGATGDTSVVVRVGTPSVDREPVINEFHVDTPGGDSGTFVELCGTPGASAAGLELIGIRGQNGERYNTITLRGTFDANGLLLVADPDAPFRDLAAVVSGNTDYENGPDSIQLRRSGTVIDAVAYGSFASGDRRAGEGSPVRLPADRDDADSLQRNRDCRDTNTNSADFQSEEPTPGEPNGWD